MLLISCPFGLSSLLTNEIKRLDMQPVDVFPTGCWIDSKKRKDIITLNLSLRIANKVYLELATGPVETFEDLFQLVQTVQWDHYFKDKTPFKVTALTKNSSLHAPRTIQSIGHKALVTQLTGSKDAQRETDGIDPIEVLIRIIDNQAHILLNTSGQSLHARGWRVATGEAPIKENLAAATVLLASRGFSQPLWDPCCGSGTMVIEAARYARNILTGKQRRFDFQRLATYSSGGYEGIRSKLVEREITDKSWMVVASDIDPEVLEKARRNAKQAGVADIITFVEHDVLSSTLPTGLDKVTPTTIICNPPYGERLDGEIDDIHFRLAEIMRYPGWNGAVISGYENARKHFPSYDFKNKETRNGPDKCMIWVRKRFAK